MSAPHLMIQLFFALLVIFFFLAGWTMMRKQTIVSRGSFEGALTTARVIEEVVDATATYIGTITFINVGLGALTALILWFMGMESPIMWGGIVAVANYIPYLGPIVSAGLLFIGGLMTYPDAWTALGPPATALCATLAPMGLGFGYRTTKDGSVRVTRDGRLVSVIGGAKASKLRAGLEHAAGESERQALLAKATGNYRSGNKAGGRG